MTVAAPLALALSLVLVGCAAGRPAPPSETGGVDGPPWPEPTVDADLQAAVEDAVAGFDGVVGVYARHLPTGRAAMLRADERFPTASMIKVPLLVTVFDQIESGDLSYTQTFGGAGAPEYAYKEGGLIGQLRADAEVQLHQLAEAMVAASDNVASLWLQREVGGGGEVNEWLAAHGYDDTRVNSRTPGREADYEAFGWGQTTPREMARLLQSIAEGGAVSPEADLEMHRLLSRTFYDDEAVSAIPPGVQVVSKQGAVMESRSEVAYVHAPSGPYVVAVITRDQGDTRYEPDNAGYQLIRNVSALLWAAFEPAAPPAPPAAARYRF